MASSSGFHGRSAGLSNKKINFEREWEKTAKIGWQADFSRLSFDAKLASGNLRKDG